MKYNDYPFADLHVHSYYSVGTFSPAEILSLAEKKGVGLLAVADHDCFAGSEELCSVCAGSPVKCVPAVEITCTENRRQVHVLGYRPDFSNRRFSEFVSEGRRKLDGMSVSLIIIMKAAGYDVDVGEFENFRYDRSGGGWKALHYFRSKGIIKDLFDGFTLYPDFGCDYADAGFPGVRTAIEEVHSAGGIAIIAHPGVSLTVGDSNRFMDELMTFVSYGADGIECFYPEHSLETTAVCEHLCDALGLLKTCGSDHHGNFNMRPVGIPAKRISELRLGDILSGQDCKACSN